MNPEVIKAMNRKNEKHPVRNWWRKNGYKVLRIVLFPIWTTVRIAEKIRNKIWDMQKWDENRARDILNYYIPRRAEWDEESKSFCFFDNGMGWYINIAKRYLKFKDRRFWNRFRYHIQAYLRDTFELEGFTKEVGDCSEGWTEIYFHMNEGQVE